MIRQSLPRFFSLGLTLTFIVALLAFRLAWAFFGPEYSRLVSMVRSTG